MSNERRRSSFGNHLLFLVLIIGSTYFVCFARHTIAAVTELLIDDSGDTLVSVGEMFELGFFTSGNGNSPNTYVGIWYYRSNPQVFIWVANRDNPLLEPGGVFAIKDGNLEVLDRNETSYWSTGLASSLSTDQEVELIDSGMKMDENLKLTSWASPDNPSTGNFTFKSEGEDNQFIISQKLVTYWRNGEIGNSFSSDEMPTTISYFLSNFSNKPKVNNSKKVLPISLPQYKNTRLVMSFTGEIQFWSWNKDKMEGFSWSLIWLEPADKCGISKFCGDFGSCNNNNILKCKCLPGFVPRSPDKWKSRDFSDGCTQKSTACGDTFLGLPNMKVRKPDTQTMTQNESECRKECLNDCKCLAYSYVTTDNTRGDVNASTSFCWAWTEDIYNLQEQYTNNGLHLYIRVLTSDIKSTRKNCETCGTSIVPYPLSTGPHCGDPMYNSFQCDNSSGEVRFRAPSGTYPVTVINPDTRSFIIQTHDADNCGARNSRDTLLQLNESLPFRVTSWCVADLINSLSDTSSKWTREIEISWAPPGEPTCSSSEGCMDWPNTFCNKADDGQRRCLCRTPFLWNSSAMNCTHEFDINVEQGASIPPSEQSQSLVTILVATLLSFLVVSCVIFIYLWRRKKSGQQHNSENAQRQAAIQLYDSEKRVKEMMGSGQFSEEDKKGIDLPFFDFLDILTATDNFSEANKLGKGGFGPVYKGYFPGGQEIAVKRLSSLSGQGLEEFKNEIVLIARLQHRNLVRLLGYCVRGDEKILLYEYMPNKSLDFFLFDESRSVMLDWEMRFNIILGICRGLVYLHQDSRLRVIHRDLKASNILLDSEMNPKISDFGLARIFEGKQTEGATNKVVGTYGYMSPEYALEGVFSIKSDVFSFGVVILEIISGKKNTGFYQSEKALNLLGYAWKMWQEDKVLDIMEERIRLSCKNTSEILKCINIGLLCVEEDPSERPNMSTVMTMLSSEATFLPPPRQPAFVLRQRLSTTASSSSKPDSNTPLTDTILHGR
ncbi:G-type lectin S-receptor-like serine/threonine-protein kinase At4g03230 isoform X2 [Carica papaya]|uniref:G-type lectin S-receptor-like serine/threonine-protein kinase At4g03230 isoform X2 n=1 Tax=Carica papaya TaxID=3649 RepID=UPI000B8CCE80|nr:G-type lectin S-receptor-like serine/threonine-protein kinase At4g03230 isoform X2 [Carica papaya]